MDVGRIERLSDCCIATSMVLIHGHQVGKIIGTLWDIMVHFSSTIDLLFRPTTPPVCPKCGSHRTEIIGKLDDSTQRTVRCNACGAISTVPVSEAQSFIEGASSAA